MRFFCKNTGRGSTASHFECPSLFLGQCCGCYIDEDPTLLLVLFSSSRKIHCPPAPTSFLLSAAHLSFGDISQWFSGLVPTSFRHVFCSHPGIFQQLTICLYPSDGSQMPFVDSVPIFSPLFSV